MSANLSDYISSLNEGFITYCSVRLERHGLSYSQYSFIEYMGSHPGCTPGELSTAVKADNGYTTRMINKMIDSGMATKQRAVEDKRVYMLNLTDKGKDAFVEIKDLYGSWEREMLEGLDESEREMLIKLLRKLMH